MGREGHPREWAPEEARNREYTKLEVEAALDAFRSLLFDLKDYAVYGSTALYLYNAENPDTKLAGWPMPTDMDIAVGNANTLAAIRERLGNLSGIVTITDNGAIPDKVDGHYTLAGTIEVTVTEQGRARKVAFPFEIILQSRFVRHNSIVRASMKHGLRCLAAEDMQHVYGQLANYGAHKQKEGELNDKEAQKLPVRQQAINNMRTRHVIE